MSAHDRAIGRQPTASARRRQGHRASGSRCWRASALSILLLGVLLVRRRRRRRRPPDASTSSSNFPSIDADKAGIQAALWGTLWLMGVCAVFIVPVGVATAIYLEEYADNDALVQPR